jgi:hypothetical protein
MAIYQYYLAIVPKHGILKKHNLIPNEIRINTETGYFESDAELYWKEIDQKANKITPKIDSFIKRADWGNDKTSFNWKTKSKVLDNDAFMGINEKTFSITEFSFRADLREDGFTFLKNMIELGKENNWILFESGNIFEFNNFENMEYVRIEDGKQKRTHNSGLLQWLLPDFPAENPLLNGMFCYICNGLVLVQRH